MTDRGFTLTRTLEAPRELVFQAWTDPEHMQWYFNPAMHTDEPISVDLRVGGQWRVMMVINEKLDYFTGGVYLELVPPERIVFAWGATDGWPKVDTDRLHDGPIATITLAEAGEQTEMSFHLGFPDDWSDEQVREAVASGMRDGWGDTIDRLVAELASRSPRVAQGGTRGGRVQWLG
jgi:uncharacterized protein YndB with AHSA1/START domain